MKKALVFGVALLLTACGAAPGDSTTSEGDVNVNVSIDQSDSTEEESADPIEVPSPTETPEEAF